MPLAHPRLEALVSRAREFAAKSSTRPAIGLVYPCDALALEAALRIDQEGIARPVLIGPLARVKAAASSAQLDIGRFETVDIADTDKAPSESAQRACELANQGKIQSLMKGSLHTDELMSAVVDRATGLRTARRISHVFIFDLPRYHKLLALADCVVNISPDLKTKHDILANAYDCLIKLGIAQPKIAVIAAVETVNPAIPATLDAQALVEMWRAGEWPKAILEGPFGFDNAISAESARIKRMQSVVAGDPDLLIMPDLNAGNMLYKSFNYIGGGDCAGIVLGTRVPVVITSRADSTQARIASVALAVLTAAP